MGLLYQSGINDIPGFDKAIYWLKLASKSGNLKADGAIDLIYLHGQGLEKSTPKAIHFLELSAAKGEVYSKYNSALLLRGVDGGPIALEKSSFWTAQAAQRGLVEAQVI